MKAKQQVEKVSRSYIRWARKFAEQKNEEERRHELARARKAGSEEGHAIGHAEGELKGKLEIINLLKSGKSPEEIINMYK